MDALIKTFDPFRSAGTEENLWLAYTLNQISTKQGDLCAYAALSAIASFGAIGLALANPFITAGKALHAAVMINSSKAVETLEAGLFNQIFYIISSVVLPIIFSIGYFNKEALPNMQPLITSLERELAQVRGVAAVLGGDSQASLQQDNLQAGAAIARTLERADREKALAVAEAMDSGREEINALKAQIATLEEEAVALAHHIDVITQGPNVRVPVPSRNLPDSDGGAVNLMGISRLCVIVN